MKKLALLAVSAAILPFATTLLADTYSTSPADAWSQDGNTFVFDSSANGALGSTPELRKTVAQLLVKAGKRVNAVYDLDPENEKAATAIKKVCGVISDFKRIASEAKHRKGDTPDPEPELMSNGDAPAA